MRPTAEHPPYTRYEGAERFAPGTVDQPLAPHRLRWDPLPLPQAPVDLIVGMTTLMANRAPATLAGIALHVYAAPTDTHRLGFVDAADYLLFMPETGQLALLAAPSPIEPSPAHQ